MSTFTRQLQVVADLRSQLHGQLGLKEQKILPWSLWAGGLPRPGMIEMTGRPGSGKTEALLVFLKEHPDLRVAWLEEKFNFFPACLGQYQIPGERILFISVDKKDHSDWVFQQIIAAQIFDVVILSNTHWNEAGLRRAQLLSEKNNVVLVCLHNEFQKRQNAWVFDLQLCARRGEDGKIGLSPSREVRSRTNRVLSLRSER